MNGPLTLDDWLAALSLGVSGCAVWSGLFLLLVDADPADFDPRPAARRVLAVAHQGVVDAGHDLNRALAALQLLARHTLRDAALTAAALLILTIPTGEPR